MRVPDQVLVLPTNGRKSKDFIDCYYGRDVPTKFSEITFQVSRKLSRTFNFLCFSSGRRRYENDLTEFFKLFKDYSRIQASDIPASTNSATMFVISSIECVPLARLCRIVLAILFDMSLSITTTGNFPPSRS